MLCDFKVINKRVCCWGKMFCFIINCVINFVVWYDIEFCSFKIMVYVSYRYFFGILLQYNGVVIEEINLWI